MIAPPLFGCVHGDVGVFEKSIDVPPVGREEGDSDAGGAEDFLLADGEGGGEALEDRPCKVSGLLFVGLDVIGDWVTEVNVTSPTCFREIQDQTGFDVAGMYVEALQKKLRA